MIDEKEQREEDSDSYVECTDRMMDIINEEFDNLVKSHEHLKELMKSLCNMSLDHLKKLRSKDREKLKIIRVNQLLCKNAMIEHISICERFVRSANKIHDKWNLKSLQKNLEPSANKNTERNAT